MEEPAPTPEVKQDTPVPAPVETKPPEETEIPEPAVINGGEGTPNGHKPLEEDENVNDDPLSPPPETMSPASEPSAPPNEPPEDEIVVGINANANKASPARIPEKEDHDMEDVNDDLPALSHYPKRKRSSVYHDLSEDRIENSLGGDEVEAPPPKGPGRPRAHGITSVKSVVLGYWRDSPVPDEKDKHAVIGFIDVRDRLRTRIQQHTRSGKDISKEYALPPGPGGSWVTFERVVFEKHLVNLDHYQVKEYVKLRAEAQRHLESEEDAKIAEKAAVKEAIRRVQVNPPPDTAQPPPIAYGPEIPEHAQIPQRPEPKKRRIGSAGTPGAPASSTQSGPSTPAPTDDKGFNPVHALHDSLPGTRPTKILLGYWKGSAEDVPNKHAVFGILGANDMFRVKVTRETRDGRTVISNFPTGAGALWIAYDEVEFEDHLKGLSRPEIKEYVRVRQRQLDDGEGAEVTPEERHQKELKAVQEAQIRAVANYKVEPRDPAAYAAAMANAGANPAVNGTNGTNGVRQDGYDTPLTGSVPKRENASVELRHSRRSETMAANRPGRHSLPDTSDLRAANRPQSVDAVERTNTIARREIARVEAAQLRADQRAANREAASSRSGDNKSLFQDNVSRLNKVWASQEANRLKVGGEDAKMYMGIKYERKRNGPFEGKLVSQGTIISIDGEDYVEYRVLTKPSFF